MVYPRYKNYFFLRALGAHCRKIRKKKAYSIDRMSKEGDQLSTGAIQRLETGDADVHVSLLYRYSEVLDIPVHESLNFEWKKEDNEIEILPHIENKAPPKGYIPYYPIEIAAGLFNQDSFDINPQGWIKTNKKSNLDLYFAAHIYGDSMSPTIPDGSLCLFKKYTGGSRNGKIMLVQARGINDPEMGYRFVIKRYQRQESLKEGESREGAIIHLISDNSKFKDIVLKGLSDDEVSTPAEFVQVL